MLKSAIVLQRLTAPFGLLVISAAPHAVFIPWRATAIPSTESVALPRQSGNPLTQWVTDLMTATCNGLAVEAGAGMNFENDATVGGDVA